VAVFRPLPHPAVATADRTAALHQPAAPMVGRDAELAALMEQLAALQRGDSGLALVEGEAGLGKSRLLMAFLREAEAAGVHILLGAGDAVEQRPPYHAWRPVFERLLGWEELPEEAEARRAALRFGLAYPETQAARVRQTTEEFKHNYCIHRSGVEGCLSALVWGHGMRRNRYRRRATNRIRALCTGAAVNLARAAAWRAGYRPTKRQFATSVFPLGLRCWIQPSNSSRLGASKRRCRRRQDRRTTPIVSISPAPP
jgi:hypothetical protein